MKQPALKSNIVWTLLLNREISLTSLIRKTEERTDFDFSREDFNAYVVELINEKKIKLINNNTIKWISNET